MASDAWVCADCGLAGAEPLAKYTMFDDRYTTGYCDACNAPSSTRKTARPTHALIRTDLFDRGAWTERKQRARLGALVQTFRRAGAQVQMKDNEVHELVTLYDRWGFAGYGIAPELREVSKKYATATAPKPKSRRRR